MKKIFIWVFCLVLGVAFCLPGTAFFAPAISTAEALPFEIDAKSVILMEAESGQVVAQKNSDMPQDLCGAVKVLSELVVAQALENGTLTPDMPVTVSTTAIKGGGMSAFLNANESYPAETLIRAMLVVSANDATRALAEKLCGTEEMFVQQMGQTASALGLSPTLVNATGHNAAGQAMTVRDAAMMARELVKYEQMLEWGKKNQDTIIHGDGRVTELNNPNKLVRFYPGCDGIATGSSSTAGYSGVFTASRNGIRYIVAIAGAPRADARAEIAKKLFDYAFANFTAVKVIEKGKGLAKDVPVENGVSKTVHGVANEDVYLLVSNAQQASVQKEAVLSQEKLIAPVRQGQPIGELIVRVEGKEAARIPIVAQADVDENSFARGWKLLIKEFLHY